MKWTDCRRENAEFTNDYDRACREIRRVLGSYDRIAQIYFSVTGTSVAGVSVRRWMNNRALPIEVATTLVESTREVDADAKVSVFDFFPYLREHATREFTNDDYLD